MASLLREEGHVLTVASDCVLLASVVYEGKDQSAADETTPIPTSGKDCRITRLGLLLLLLLLL